MKTGADDDVLVVLANRFAVDVLTIAAVCNANISYYNNIAIFLLTAQIVWMRLDCC